MKRQWIKTLVSVLLAVGVLAVLLPPAAFAESAYIRLGEISQVTVNAVINPTPGGKNAVEKWEIASPRDQGVGSQGSWQRWNETAGTWELYGVVSHPVMEEGTYRYHVQIRTDKNEVNEYYALTEDAALLVNGVPWTKESSVLSYDSHGCGLIWYCSPSFIVSEDGGNSAHMIDLMITTPPTKTEYLTGEYFDRAGMEVMAVYDNSGTVPVDEYIVTDGMALADGQTSVTLSYTEGGVTETVTQPITVSAEPLNGKVFEVHSWSEFKDAFAYSAYRGEDYTIKLMNNLYYDAANIARNATVIVDVEVKGCNVTLDFHGHTLFCTDAVSQSDLQSPLSDFIRITLHPIDPAVPVVFRLTDSVGGGGVKMTSHRAYDNQLAALHIVDAQNYMIGNLYQSCAGNAELIIDGGTYTLDAKTEKLGRGTYEVNSFYRGTVIADAMNHIEINGGTFKATSDGAYYDGSDFCARELSAFATCSNRIENAGNVKYEHTVINGGTFISDGYAIHHFDHSLDMNKTMSMRFPLLNGGIFSGAVGYIGMSFTYDNYDTTGFGTEEYKEIPAADIISNEADVYCIKDGEFCDLEDLTLGDLHESSALYVFSDSLFGFKTRPVTGDNTALERYVGQQDTFEVVYEVPSAFGEQQITPYITVTPNGGTATTENVTQKHIAYQHYPDGLTVTVGIAIQAAQQVLYYENSYTVTVSDVIAPPEILAQPRSMTVAPGECAEAMVVADHAASYQWYYLYEGSAPMKLTESLVSALGGGVAGYEDAVLSVKLKGVGREYFYCVVTGTDGSTVKTDRISFTFGGSPSVSAFGGGEFYAGGDAQFKLFAMYADEITWVVMKRQSGDTSFYSLEEFAALTGCEYGTTHRSYPSGLHAASVMFKNADESWAGKYAVGYRLENGLGEVAFQPDNTVPFTLAVVRPTVLNLIETQTCAEGGTLVFTFEAENMMDADWTFEKADEDGVAVVYTLEDMAIRFPNTSFDTAITGTTATLTVSGAESELCQYLLYARAVGVSASSPAGVAQSNVLTVVESGDVNVDGAVDMMDAFMVYQAASSGSVSANVQAYGDMNDDGVIDMLDAFQVYRIASGT